MARRVPRLGRRGVEQQGAGLHRGADPSGAADHLAHHFAVGKHGDDDVGLAGELRGARCRRDAARGARSRFGTRAVGVEYRHRKAGRCQVDRHRRAHDAHADEADPDVVDAWVLHPGRSHRVKRCQLSCRLVARLSCRLNPWLDAGSIAEQRVAGVDRHRRTVDPDRADDGARAPARWQRDFPHQLQVLRLRIRRAPRRSR